MKHPPLKLMLGPELGADTELMAGLIGLGHEITILPQGYDAYISYEAWRVPPGTTREELHTYIGTVLKQIRATKHVENPTQEPAPERASKKPKSSAKRKRHASGDGQGTPSEAETGGQLDSASHHERPAKRKREVGDGQAQDQTV